MLKYVSETYDLTFLRVRSSGAFVAAFVSKWLMTIREHFIQYTKIILQKCRCFKCFLAGLVK
jgi:hypothetical protein